MEHILKKFLLPVLFVLSIFSSTSCTSKDHRKYRNPKDVCMPLIKTDPEQYISVSPEKAKKMMDESENYIILDVRSEEEYNDFHIKDAILLPDYDVRKRAKDILIDKAQKIFVYCRSGVRSKLAAKTLEEMGYTNVIEFGGIVKWPYEIVE